MKKYLFSICVLFSGGAKLLRCHQCDSNTDINCLLSFDHDPMNDRYLKGISSHSVLQCNLALRERRTEISAIKRSFFSRKNMPIWISKLL